MTARGAENLSFINGEAGSFEMDKAPGIMFEAGKGSTTAIRWWLAVFFGLTVSLAVVGTIPAANHGYIYVWIYVGTCLTCGAVSLTGIILTRYCIAAFWTVVALQVPMSLFYLRALVSIPGSDDACGMLWVAFIGTGMLISCLLAIAGAGHAIFRAVRAKD